MEIRRKLPALADVDNLIWLTPQSNHVASFMRIRQEQKLYGLFNFSKEQVFISWYIFKEHGISPKRLFDHWSQVRYEVGRIRNICRLIHIRFVLWRQNSLIYRFMRKWIFNNKIILAGTIWEPSQGIFIIVSSVVQTALV
ncbi:MAG: hypothetical protein WDM78_19205 [Puia sp.]